MINATATVIIKSVNQTHDQEGSLIAFGIAEFYTRSREGVAIDEIPYRSKGTPALVIEKNGEGAYGTVEGYIDLVIDNKGAYKGKVATLVIRNFVLSQPTVETTPVSYPKPETPDFAKELIEANISSDDEDFEEKPPF
jgi:hypothetical protein